MKQRRKFLGSLIAGAASIATIPLFGSSVNSSTKKKKSNDMKNSPILKTTALGFQWETADPFLFCVHHEDNYPKGNENMGPDAFSLEGRHLGQDFILKDGWRMYHGQEIPGFPGHPHRGFETITVVRAGIVDHADSLGGAGRYGNGDVQWMTAGKGLQHSEMFPLVNKDKENNMELFQIWLNLPKKDKMVEPHFKMLWKETIPVLTLNEKKITIEVIAGKINDQTAPSPPPNSWAAEDHNSVGIFNIKLEPGGTFELTPAGEGVNRTIYYYEGHNLKLANEKIAHYHSVSVDPTQTLTFENGEETSKVLILQGMPINEPVVQHGPFVMNTREEIQEAFNDYNTTGFGGWPWEKYDQVHDRDKGRFALHADGTEEVKD